jgi:membrane-associated phospholipid phosphatase
MKIKAKYVSFFLALFFLTYTTIQKIMTTSKFDFLTNIDIMIPIVPEFIWIYHTLMPILLITSVIIVKRPGVFFTSFLSCIIATIILGIFYVLFPSHYPRPTIIGNSISEQILRFTYMIDGPNCTFPSGHVTYSFIFYFTIKDSQLIKDYKFIQFLYLMWAILISVSTLLIKQHYIIDVLSGVLVATICYYVSKIIITKKLSVSGVNGYKL